MSRQQESEAFIASDWTSTVPARWQVLRLKVVADYFVSSVDKVPGEDEIPVRLCNYTDVYYNDVIRPDMGLMETTASMEEIRRFRLRVGDVVITKDSEDWRDIAVPALVIASAEDLVCGYHLAVVRPKPDRLSGRFLLRVFQSSAVGQQFQIAANGVTRFGLPKSAIGEALVPVPTHAEQERIADFLDRRLGHVDALVAKKQTLIDRLREKRQALISRVVTRGLPPEAAHAAGLDPSPKLMESGVEWLGEVPQHWTVLALKRTWREAEYGISEALSGTGAIRVLTMGHIREGRVELPEMGVIDEVPADLLLKAGDLLYNRTNSLANVGKVGLYDGRCDEPVSFASYLVRIRTNSRALSEFLNYLLNIDSFLAFARGLALPSINQANLNPSRYGQIMVAMPPIPEQHAIVAHLNTETARLDRLMRFAAVAISRLQEYRSALITAAVTGRIDVRGAAADRGLDEAAA